MPLKVVFFGTPEIAKTILETLLNRGVNVIAVVTKPDKPQGRSLQLKSPPVKVFADQRNIPVFQPKRASSPEFADVLRALGADVFIVVAYSEILKENLLSMPPKGCINVHASILPKYRGAAPVQRAIMAGEKETGVTIMSMALEMDAGDVYSIAKIPIPEDMNAGQLLEALAPLGAEALLEVLKEIEAGTAHLTPQDHSQATFAAKVKSEEGLIDWTKDGKELYDLYRGLSPRPGMYANVTIHGEPKRLNLKKIRYDESLHGKPGHFIDAPGYVVATGKGSLRLLEVQLEGKKTLDSESFFRGIPIKDLAFI